MPEMKVQIDGPALHQYAAAARKHGTTDKFIDLALDWADAAEAHIATLVAETIALSVYESAVKGRQEFREALRLARKRLTTAATIIEAADARAAAVDGPVNHCRDEMTDDEWRKLYLAVKGENDGDDTAERTPG